MKGRMIAVMCVAAGLMLAVSMAQASALDIQSVLITLSENRQNGVTAGYAVDVEVGGTGITNVAFECTTSSTPVSMTFNAGTGKYEFEQMFTSLSAFQAAFPSPLNNYQFLFNKSGTIYADSVVLGYAVAEPSDYLHNTSPTMNETGVPLTPTFTWLTPPTGLWALGERVRTSGGVPVFDQYPDMNTADTSWTPGALSPGSYQLILEDYAITSGQPINTQTGTGDLFTYYALFGQSNQIDFSTSFSSTPEPASMMLFGTAALGLAGWVTRRRMK